MRITNKFIAGSATSGQVLTSTGSSTAPTWQTPASLWSWTSYTPTFTNTGTTSNVEFWWKQSGANSIDITGRVTFAAVVDTNDAQISIPSSLTVNSTVVTTQRQFGSSVPESLSGAVFVCGATGGNTYFVIYDQNTATNVSGTNASALTWDFHITSLPVSGL